MKLITHTRGAGDRRHTMKCLECGTVFEVKEKDCLIHHCLQDGTVFECRCPACEKSFCNYPESSDAN